jgi:asparagine synthase (glutamine-hydrolysing)
MCGIAGIVDFQSNIDPAAIAMLCRLLSHRGPDDHGVYFDQNSSFAIGLGTQRLSILDLSAAGHMPMQHTSGNLILSYNGELYNHYELRRNLEARGYAYRSRTDTETVLYAYQEYGLGCLQQFNGMFAFALYDRQKQQLLLARDRMGIKPLYYAWDGRRLVFASELKALLALPTIQRRIDPHALDLYLSLGYVPSPYTLIAGVAKLEPGQYLLLQDGQLSVHTYWQQRIDAANTDYVSDGELIAQIRQALESAVQRQLMSDVPVGVLLSGGIDSTIIAALAQRNHTASIDTFSVGFNSVDAAAPITAEYNADRQFAALAAERLGTRHHEVIVPNDTTLINLLTQLVRSLDEPVWEASFVSIYLLCRLARSYGVKVVLSGDGSDELFAGYPWYRGAQRLANYERIPLLGKLLPGVSKLFAGSNLAHKATDLQQKLHQSASVCYRLNYDQFSQREKALLLGQHAGARSEDTVDTLIAPLLQSAYGSLADQFAYADRRLWVGDHFNQRLDRMSSACSVESRVPFQDNAVLDLAATIPVARNIRAGEQKYLLRRACADLIPPEIMQRPKRPFAAPQHAWFQQSLRGWVYELLQPQRVKSAGLVDSDAVQQILMRYMSGQEQRVEKISILIMLQLWCEEVLHADQVLAPASFVLPSTYYAAIGEP